MAGKKISIDMGDNTELIVDVPLFGDTPESWVGGVKITGCVTFSTSGGAIYEGEVIEDNIKVVKRSSDSMKVSGNLIGTVDVKGDFLKDFISGIEDSSMNLRSLTFLFEDKEYVSFIADDDYSPIEGSKISLL